MQSGVIFSSTIILIDNTVFATGDGAVVIDKLGNYQRLAVDSIGNLPIIDANAEQLYWFENGNISRQHPLGLEYQHQHIGQGINGRTLLWAGSPVGSTRS